MNRDVFHFAAALAGFALTACSEEKHTATPKETQVRKPINLQEGFYKTLRDNADLVDPAYGFNNIITSLSKGSCLRVADGVTNPEYAYVETLLYRSPEERVRGMVLKRDLMPAPECAP